MRRRIALYLLFTLVAAACTEDRNSYNSIEFEDSNGNEGGMRRITIDEMRSKFQGRAVYHGSPTAEGKLYDTFSIAKPGIYLFNLMVSGTYIYLRPGDATKISISGDGLSPTYKFEGDGADINRFLTANEQIMKDALAPLTEASLEHLDDAEVAAIVGRIRAGEQQLLQQSGNALPDTLREFVRVENVSKVASFCMFYRYKRNKLSPTRIATPQTDRLLQEFDGNKPGNFELSPAYREAAYEYHKEAFQATDGGTNRLQDFNEYITNKAVAPPIRDYLLAKFAGNYCLTAYADPAKMKADYDYLISVLTDAECRTQVYQEYAAASRRTR